MALSGRVFNQTRGCYMKRNQALKAVDNCAVAWVEFGISVRVLTYAESREALNHQAQTRERLAFAEQPGCVYRPTESNIAQYRRGLILVREANQFAAMCAA